MTRCGEFYEKIERDGNFCNMDKTAYQRTLDYIAFCKETNMPLGSLSERAARPLIKEKDPDVKAKAIESIGKQLNKGRVPTARQVTNLVQNTEDGKSARGGDHKGAEIIEQVAPETDVDVEIEGDPEMVEEELEGPDVEEDLYSGDMPDTPDAQEKVDSEGKKTYEWGGVIAPKDVPVVEDKDDEEETGNNPEITEKVVKEYLRNAGHKGSEPTPQKIPSEEDKQGIFDKCIKQAYEWGIDGDEIARRMENAIIYIHPTGIGVGN